MELLLYVSVNLPWKVPLPLVQSVQSLLGLVEFVCLIELNRGGSTVLDKSSAASRELELIRNPGVIVSGLHKLC